MSSPELHKIALREITADDLPIFFEQQLDPDANYMAAFTAEDPADRDAFMKHWQKVLSDDRLTKRTILFNGEVAGYIVSFDQFGKPSIGYWIGKPFWGKGVATRALTLFLEQVQTRPLFARVVKDNLASRRVLEKCGFVLYGEDKGYASARRAEVEEYILILHPTC
jgi:RimJ/RimL family protein N-acetyltransferase